MVAPTISEPTEIIPVSIPFKRESVSKAGRDVVYHLSGPQSFNSLQTGKRIQSFLAQTIMIFKEVSIPFKRESVSKAIGLANPYLISLSFQFPSNGKAYPKNSVPTSQLQSGWLVRFNSLQTGKRIQRIISIQSELPRKRFNSLQTGKRIQSSGSNIITTP